MSTRLSIFFSKTQISITHFKSLLNILAIIAGILVLTASGVHAIMGAKEFSKIKPDETGKSLEVWVQTLSGWHWVTVDQLLAGGFLLVIGLTDWIKFESTVLMFIGSYFVLTGFAWLLTVLASGRAIDQAPLKLGQWIYCFFIAGLAFWASI